ncbi:hypothetical protein [Arthrobacter sp. ZBG10]|uniref:hypothetical protein n=1 Tax=Arthrobacter sp. ZBG10 TaxID=1676590 RepID=UPI0012FC98DB|nr:hypothetical protein [Arthrobacter sp. ZBG10]
MGKGSRLRKKEVPNGAAVYWHGGAAGRAVGEALIPGVQVPGYRHVVAAFTPQGFAEYRPDFAYITTDRDLAFDYAVEYYKLGLGPSSLYKVVPLGKSTHDPDYPTGVSFRCKGSRVVAVELDEFTVLTKETGAALRYRTWDDNSPLFDNDGYPLPNKVQKHFGVTAEDLRNLGYGADFSAIHQRCMELVGIRNPGITQADIDRVIAKG